ncbi:hypothetical protein T11_11379 [Trichinella zimbabwensis]|uniref:Uncharacterized protein n=1 Tax=Trichinella zimbabwensis TaxID=268475 RepID=A0A0V1GHL6_9BILA|nr:hypothetical protein T11_11379 [Trichinella zimbabwensis]
MNNLSVFIILLSLKKELHISKLQAQSYKAILKFATKNR